MKNKKTSLNPAQSRRVDSQFSNGPKFSIGDVVCHKLFGFRGVIFDVDPQFSNSEEWYYSIPENVRPRRDQPYYHLFAENEESSYEAYVSQQNLIHDAANGPVNHPAIPQIFQMHHDGKYQLRSRRLN